MRFLLQTAALSALSFGLLTGEKISPLIERSNFDNIWESMKELRLWGSYIMISFEKTEVLMGIVYQPKKMNNFRS